MGVGLDPCRQLLVTHLAPQRASFLEAHPPEPADLNSRRGIIMETEARDLFTVIRAEVPLASMFGYATVVRGLSKGMATFTMEMSHYAQVPVRIAEEIIAKRKEKSQQTARK